MKQILLGAVALGSLACTVSASASEPLDAWIVRQSSVSTERMLQNISPAGTAPGTVIASPSRRDPDYYFHWTRDSALVFDQVVRLYIEAGPGPERDAHLKRIADFVALSSRQQQMHSADGLGEPRYSVDGSVDTIPWSRPQHDGPALRALTLMSFVSALPEEPSSEAAARASREAIEVIERDLRYAASKWRETGYDLWEELRGDHFYTHAVQYAALRKGVEFFGRRGQAELAGLLERELGALARKLESYWEAERGYIGASRDLALRPEAPRYKDENLDTAVVLAALHASIGDGASVPTGGILSISDDRVLATAHALELAFARAYRINAGASRSEGIAIGRFTDDVYFNGNPWYMTTAAFAELYYRLARLMGEGAPGFVVTPLNQGFLQDAAGLELAPGQRLEGASAPGRLLRRALFAKGDGYIGVIQRYAGSQGELSEQFDRDAGVPVSAYDLTWSYAAFLSAVNSRN